MVGVKSLLSLKYPATRTCRFLICIGTSLFVSKSFPKDDVLPLHTMHRHLSCKWLILLFILWLQNILKDSKGQLWRKKSSWICVFFQNSWKAIFSRWHLRFDLLFLKCFLSVRWISVYNQCLNAIVLLCVRFPCSVVLSWCSVGVRRCTVVLPLFWSVVLFRHYSRVFRCSASVLCFIVPCFSVPGFIVWIPI